MTSKNDKPLALPSARATCTHPGEQDLGTNLGTLTNKSHQEVLINSMMMRASIVATRVAIFNSLHAVIGR
jgi:hypothetical protein